MEGGIESAPGRYGDAVERDCARTIVSIQTGTIAVTWNLTFAASYAGPRSLYLKATDRAKLASGWKKKGAVTIGS
jgi:hypothetical protein